MANVIDSLNYGNNVYTFTLPYGTCSTAAATAEKAVTVSNFSLETGARIAVKISYKNTASSPTLNVNSAGAKPIYYNGAAITAGFLDAKKVYEFVYNGTQWELIGDINTDTHCVTGISVGASAASSNAATTDPYVVIRDDSSYRGQVRFKGDGATTVTSDANGNITISSDNTDTQVKYRSTNTNGNYPIALAPYDVEDGANRYSFYNDGIYANPSLKRIYADINGASTGVRGITSGNFLVGNGTGTVAMVEKTPAEVLTHIGAAPSYTYSTTDLTAGTSALTTGKMYLVYE